MWFSKLIMKPFVIGISGVTNGGKTTLAKNLQKHFPNCSIISQDDFFKPESEIEKDKNGFLQYDVLEALNMEKMMSAISCWMDSPRHSLVSTDRGSSEETSILIIEGFLLFNYKPLNTIWNRSYFLTIPYEECKRRRSTRVYEPPDPPGYFDGHVWPMYLKHRREIEDITWDIIYLDGTKSEEDLFSQVYEDLIQELAKQKYNRVWLYVLPTDKDERNLDVAQANCTYFHIKMPTSPTFPNTKNSRQLLMDNACK